MPYWSSSRVGVVNHHHNHHQKHASGGNNTKKGATDSFGTPTTSNHQNSSTINASNQQQQQNRRGGGTTSQQRRGITMEDLKKQTALRLAQEQNHQQNGSVNSTSKVAVLPSSPSPMMNDPTDLLPPHVSASSATPTRTPTKSSSYFFSRNSASQQHHPTPSPPPPPTTTKQYPRSLFSPRTNRSSITKGSTTSSNALGTVSIAPSQTSGSTASSSSEASNNGGVVTDTVVEKGTNAKLPHGLTVSELKEMTKARLQAEQQQHHYHNPAVLTSPVLLDTSNNNNTGITIRPMAPSPLLNGLHHPMNNSSRMSPYPPDSWDTSSVISSTASSGEYQYQQNRNPSPSFPHSSGMMMDVYTNSGGRTSSGAMTMYPSSQQQQQNQDRWMSFAASSQQQHLGATASSMSFNRTRAATASPCFGLSSSSSFYNDTFHHDSDHSPNRGNNRCNSGSNYLQHGNNSNSLQLTMNPEISRTTAFDLPNHTGGSEFNTSSMMIMNRNRTHSLPAVLLPSDILSSPDDDFTLPPFRRENTSTENNDVLVAGLTDTFHSSSKPIGTMAGTSTTSINNPSFMMCPIQEDVNATSLFGNNMPLNGSSIYDNIGTIDSTSTTTTGLEEDLAHILKLSTSSSSASTTMVAPFHGSATNSNTRSTLF